MPDRAPLAPHMIAAPEARAQVLLSSVRTIEDQAARDALLDELLARPAPTTVGFVNAHALNLVWNDPDILAAFKRADVLLRDGSGMRIWMRSLGLPEGINLNGTDLIPQILERIGSRKLAIFGTADPYLQKVAEMLETQGRTVVATANGFKPLQFYADLAARAQPNVVLLAMGMPKQEQAAELIRSAVSGPCLILCGGAIVDFLAGRFSRAPLWMRRLGVEWLYRLALEPRRLFRRYVIGVPVSMYRLSRVKRLVQA